MNIVIVIVSVFQFGIFRRYRWQANSPIANCDGCYVPFRGLFVCLSVCPSRSYIVLKRQKISTRFLLHRTVPCLSNILLKFCLYRSTLSPQILSQNDSPTVDLNVGDSTANCGRTVRDRNGHNREPIGTVSYTHLTLPTNREV